MIDSLAARLSQVEIRNLEQDERLTNNELRIEKLERMIGEPLDLIMKLEASIANIHHELNNKVSVQDLYNELLKKADINSLKSIE